MSMTDRDFLDELVDERTARTPDFPAMVEAAERRRKLLGALAERRREGEQSQTAVAAAMNSSQSSIARPVPEAEAGPAVVVHGAEARPDQRETA
jgi:hypothetical protein